jgi:hypothetical protein
MDNCNVERVIKIDKEKLEKLKPLLERNKGLSCDEVIAISYLYWKGDII